MGRQTQGAAGRGVGTAGKENKEDAEGGTGNDTGTRADVA